MRVVKPHGLRRVSCLSSTVLEWIAAVNYNRPKNVSESKKTILWEPLLDAFFSFAYPVWGTIAMKDIESF